MMRRAQRKKGYTLIELMIVLVVMGILITAGFARYRSTQARVYDATMKADLMGAMTSMEDYKVQLGELPPSSASLEARTGFRLSHRVSWEDYNRRMVGSNFSVYMEVSHPASPHVWHADYPACGSDINRH